MFSLLNIFLIFLLAERVDFTSLLQIICQKVRWNLPEYKECSSSQGGFGYKCRVGQKWFESKEFSSTKKDAKHNAAKWALLELEIPGLGELLILSAKVFIHMNMSENMCSSLSEVFQKSILRNI